MTVVNANRKDQYNGNGSTTVFNYNYKIFKQSELEVTLKNVNGVESLLTLTTHYSVSGAGKATGGSVTMVTAPVTGETLTIKRVVVEDQQTDLRNQGAWLPEVVEDMIDGSRMIDLQQREDLDRTPKLPVSSSLSGLVFPDSPSPGSKLFRWNAAGTALELVTASDAGFSTIMAPAMQVGSPVYGTGATSFGQVPSVKYAGAYADFATAVSTIGATVTTLIISELEVVASNVTVPSTLSLEFKGQGELSVNATFTVTINGSLLAPLKKIFSGAGSIVFGIGTVDKIQSLWFGVDPTKTADSTTSFQKAFDASAASSSIPVVLSPGNYRVSSVITTKVPFEGEGYTGSIIFFPQNSAAVFNIQKKDYGDVGNFWIDYTDVGRVNITSSAIGVQLLGGATANDAISFGKIKNIRIRRGYNAIKQDSTSSGLMQQIIFEDILALYCKDIGIDLVSPVGKNANQVQLVNTDVECAGGGVDTWDAGEFTTGKGYRFDNIINLRLQGTQVARPDGSVNKGAYEFVSIKGLVVDNGNMENIQNWISGGTTNAPIHFIATEWAELNFHFVSNTINVGAGINGNYMYFGPDTKSFIINNIGEQALVVTSGNRKFFELESTSTGRVFVAGIDITRSNILATTAQNVFLSTENTYGTTTLANVGTPSVLGGRVFFTGGTTTITDLNDAITGKEVVIISKHAVTITDGTNIFLSASANFLMKATDTVTLVFSNDGNWYETSRSVN